MFYVQAPITDAVASPFRINQTINAAPPLIHIAAIVVANVPAIATAHQYEIRCAYKPLDKLADIPIFTDTVL